MNLSNFVNQTNQPTDYLSPNGTSYCVGNEDLLGSIWNDTEPGTLAKAKCPGIEGFSKTAFATRECLSNGTWFKNEFGEYWVNYSSCLIQGSHHKVIYVYYAGHSISVLCLSVSLFIFFYFKQLRCDRITLHKNLFICHLVNALIWIAFFSDISNPDVLKQNPWHCQVLYVIATYFSVGTYFWMFSEGIYLAVILIITFNHGSMLMLICTITGWTFPFVVTLIYTLTRYFSDKPESCWTAKDRFNRILIIPNIVALSGNVIILLFIMKTLITKLRHPSNREEAQWSKTAKAVFILIPLLGLQNVILIASPSNSTYFAIHEYLSAFLSSFQGTLVSFILCFFNQEVKGIFRQRTYQSTSLQPRKSSRRSTYVSELNSSNQPRRSVGLQPMSVRSSVVSV